MRRITLFLLVALGLVAGFIVIRWGFDLIRPGTRPFIQWSLGNEAIRSELVTFQRESCPGAPFILPADGFIGLLYADPGGPYSRSNPHQGIDIFSQGDPGKTPVYAAYDGYITRQEDWRSTLIQRVPEDPLNPDRQIWLYYTHMADESGKIDFIEDIFKPGTYDLFVEKGTLLGYTGNYSGDPLRSVWVHLHFSIVLDDGRGGYRNELDIENTIDPSPYLGMSVNYACAPAVPGCSPNPLCSQAEATNGGGG